MSKYLGTPNKEKLQLFDKSLMTVEFFHGTMLSFKGMRFCSIQVANHKNLFGTLIVRHPCMILFGRTENLLKSGFHHRCFPASPL